MRVEQVQQLSAWLAATDIGLLELRGPEGTLRLRNDGTGVEVLRDAAPTFRAIRRVETATVAATAASVGVFLHHHPLHNVPLVQPGARVHAGQVLGLLQIGALLLPVPAQLDGTVTSLLAAHRTTVGYGTPLVELQPL